MELLAAGLIVPWEASDIVVSCPGNRIHVFFPK